MRLRNLAVSLIVASVTAYAVPARAELPAGYLVWTKGEANNRQSRKIYRMTLPGKTDVVALTAGEDVEPKISPNGKWVAYAKSKTPAGDYHSFAEWSLYLVSIHGIEQGHAEIKIDSDGYWPSWGDDGALYYSQPDDAKGDHTKIIRVHLDADGNVEQRETFFETKEHFGEIGEVNECYVAPDGSWFAARTREPDSVDGVGAYQIEPPEYMMVGAAGSVGCMPVVHPSGSFAVAAGSNYGLLWGDAPGVADRRFDQVLIEPPSPQHRAYHPGFSTDGKWVLVSFGTSTEHAEAPYDVYIYALDEKERTVSDKQLLAGGGFNGWPHIWVGKLVGIDAFYPSAYTIVKGDAVMLHWAAPDAESVELDGEAVELSGELQVEPTRTTTYALRATTAFGSTSKTVQITVHDTPQPVAIKQLAVTPEVIVEGESATLTWQAINPTTCRFEGLGELDDVPMPPRGKIEISPSQDAEITLRVEGHQGPLTRTVSLRVRERKELEPLEDRGGFACSTTSGADLPLLLLLGLWVVSRRLLR